MHHSCESKSAEDSKVITGVGLRGGVSGCFMLLRSLRWVRALGSVAPQRGAARSL